MPDSVPSTSAETEPTQTRPTGKPSSWRSAEQVDRTDRGWEQDDSEPWMPRSTVEPDKQSTQAAIQADTPSPAVEPIYLRSESKPRQSKSGDEPSAKAVDTDEAVVDGITRSVMDLFERSIRASVLAAVRELAPHMVITFPEARDSQEVHTARTESAPREADVVEDKALRTPAT